MVHHSKRHHLHELLYQLYLIWSSKSEADGTWKEMRETKGFYVIGIKESVKCMKCLRLQAVTDILMISVRVLGDSQGLT
jgi:hypothetical protein